MADNALILNNKQSATPYILLGAAAGGTIGAISPWGFQKQKYNSFEDIINEKNDSFTKAKDKAKNNQKEYFEKLETAKNEYNAIAEKQHEIMEDALEKHSYWDDKLDKTLTHNVDTAKKSMNETRENLIKEIEKKIQSGEVESTIITKEDASIAENSSKLRNAAETLFKNESEEVSKKCTEKATAHAKAVADLFAATNKLEANAEELGITTCSHLDETGKKIIKDSVSIIEEAKNAGENTVKDVLEKIKIPRRAVNGIIAALIIAPTTLLFRPKSNE